MSAIKDVDGQGVGQPRALKLQRITLPKLVVGKGNRCPDASTAA
jgi:hypothetical protein